MSVHNLSVYVPFKQSACTNMTNPPMLIKLEISKKNSALSLENKNFMLLSLLPYFPNPVEKDTAYLAGAAHCFILFSDSITFLRQTFHFLFSFLPLVLKLSRCDFIFFSWRLTCILILPSYNADNKECQRKWKLKSITIWVDFSFSYE